MEFAKVIKPGFFTTIQDLGRCKQQHLGVSPSGAMDAFSLRMANLLVGNDEGAAALEATLVGPKLKILAEGAIAITGGNLSPMLNGKPLSMWKAIRVQGDDELSFGHCVEGCRAYISFAGGISVPKVMGSRSTYVRGQYGGLDGRALLAGDGLSAGEYTFQLGAVVGRRLGSDSIPDYHRQRPVRIIAGPQWDAFTRASLEAITSKQYVVTNESDRMGYRLQGEQLHHLNGADIISDFIAKGSIQVPAAGQPIVLMSDCQTTGGYAKIGVIISVDLPYAAQKKPGDSIYFELMDVSEAQTLLVRQERLFLGLRLLNKRLPERRSQRAGV